MNFDDFDNGMEINEIAGADREEYNEWLDRVDAEFDDDMMYDDDGEWEIDDAMDGDHESALASAGWGTDEDYGLYSDEYEPDCDLYGEY